MQNMKNVLDYMNSESSPIQIKSNMLLSAPFVGRRNGNLMYCVFTYSVSRAKETGNRFHFSEIFYFDRRDCSKYERLEIDDLSNELSGRCFPENPDYGDVDCSFEQLYKEIVFLADAIIDKSGDRKLNARRYITCFNRKYNETIQRVYMHYGSEFFRWIGDLAMQTGNNEIKD